MLQKASKALQAQSSVVFGLLAIFDKHSGRISVVFFIVVWMRGVTRRLMCLNTHHLQFVTLFWEVVEPLSSVTLLKEVGTAGGPRGFTVQPQFLLSVLGL